MLNSTYFVGLSLFNHCAINHSVVFGVSSQRTSVPFRGQGRPYSACKKNVMEVELEVFQFSCSMKSIMSVLWFTLVMPNKHGGIKGSCEWFELHTKSCFFYQLDLNHKVCSL